MELDVFDHLETDTLDDGTCRTVETLLLAGQRYLNDLLRDYHEGCLVDEVEVQRIRLALYDVQNTFKELDCALKTGFSGNSETGDDTEQAVSSSSSY